MKKILFTLMLIISVISLSFISCNKEEDDCDCGTVTDYGYDGWDYWVSVRNECSGNIAYFSMDYYDWLNTWPGDYVCASSGNSWKSMPAEPNINSSLKDEGKPNSPF